MPWPLRPGGVPVHPGLAVSPVPRVLAALATIALSGQAWAQRPLRSSDFAIDFTRGPAVVVALDGAFDGDGAALGDVYLNIERVNGSGRAT